MAIVSIISGILSIIGLLIFFFTWGQFSLIYWVSLVLAVIAAITGYMTTDKPQGKIGMCLGLVGAIIWVLMFLWLSL